MFYNDISSCVLNNGFGSKHVTLFSGAKQGCPLSGLLLIIGIEIIGNAIRQASNIKGIDILPRKTAKLAQCVEDISIYNLLNKFESVSGLNLNQSKSEPLCLGSLRLRKLDETLNLKVTDKQIYAPGI